VEIVVRAAWDRRVAHPEAHLWARVECQPIKGTTPSTAAATPRPR
jgi:hypothetical protein